MKVQTALKMTEEIQEKTPDPARSEMIGDAERFEKQMILSEIGVEGQWKLKNARIVVVGAGGIGCPALTYLASSGVGMITVVDDDSVSLSNLPRQTIYSTQHIGENKALVAAEILCMQHPNTVFRPVSSRFDSEFAHLITDQTDLVLDCTDNHLTKYLLSDLCHRAGVPFISCAALGWEGYIGGYSGGVAPSYREVFPEAPQDFRSCDQAGVIAPAPGMFGVTAAAEAMKLILGAGKSVLGRLYRYNLLDGRFSEITFEQTIEAGNHPEIAPFHYINPADSYADWQVIDVREETEFSLQPPAPGARHIPMREILKDPKTALAGINAPLFLCAAGRRAERVALSAYLAGGFAKIGSLRGGYKNLSAGAQP